jgi:hypothetical protein
VSHLQRTIEQRLEILESAAQQLEGAQMALRHLVAQLFSKLPRSEIEPLIDSLIHEAMGQKPVLGYNCLAAYITELETLREDYT